MRQFQVRKDNFAVCRLVGRETEHRHPAIGNGQVLAKVDCFGFSANNVTYAVVGEELGYWRFFPPLGDAGETWGVTPVWGFADVAASQVDDVPVGERLFGYFPPATHLVMTPVKVTGKRFVDGAPHRAGLPPAYNNYQRVLAEPGYDRGTDNARMLLWPLYITSFCLWDALQERQWYGAKQLVIVSASSKTGIGLAYALAADKSAPAVVALTSTRNLEFVNRLGLYDKAFTYENLADMDVGRPAVIVDMSGSRQVLGQLHTRFGDNMKRCLNVGFTHWDETNSGSGIIRERSEIFFAPGHVQKRVQDWGPDGFAQRTSSFMQDAAAKSQAWLKMTAIEGLEGLEGIYPEVCAGRVAADQGLIVKLA